MRVKKTEEELRKERKEKAEEVISRIKMELLKIAKKKATAYSYLVDARNKGLNEGQARQHLRNCIRSEKKYEQTLMDLQIALETLELNEINNAFLSCINDISLSINSPKQNKLNTKKVKKNYMDAMYRNELAKEATDDMLSAIENDGYDAISGDSFSEYDDIIDDMLNKDPNVKNKTKIN